MPSTADLAVGCVAVLTTAGVLARPFDWPEAVWAVLGAVALVAFNLLPPLLGLQAVGKGVDVYLFLIGMMVLSETARREGLFDWVAALAVNRARGSPTRLFLLVYGVGLVVTTFLSNDATAVVLTPAVFAATRQAKAKPLPYLFICAFIANAASFVLPISNPANLVLYGEHIPSLRDWLASFAVPSVLAIVATYGVLRWSQGAELSGECAVSVEPPPLSGGGWLALAGLIGTAVTLLVVSWLDKPLGLPTCALGLLTAAATLLRSRSNPWELMKQVSWSVLPLVAGLFVVVEALQRSGLIVVLGDVLRRSLENGAASTAALSSAVLAIASNVVNNLPAGLIASATIAGAAPPKLVVDALLIGVDLGPNLSVTGSLATILWLTALRREGVEVGFWRFFKVGCIVMPPALLLAVGGRILLGP